MKALFGTLLTSALLVGLAYSLNCFKCDKQAKNENCLAPKPCAETEKFCQTLVTTTASGNEITKTCAKDCSTTDPPPKIFDCCNGDLCNSSGVGGVKVSVTLLSVVMCASALLLKVSL